MFKGILLGSLLSCSLIAQSLAGSGYTVPAPVSVSLRERGERSPRGRSATATDHSTQNRYLKKRVPSDLMIGQKGLRYFGV